jgi:F-type H+-transporting ATPase subunit gamma
MSDSAASLRRKIKSAGDLQGVVRSMKALAAASIGQYEKSVRAVADYERTVELGLGACFRKTMPGPLVKQKSRKDGVTKIGAIVFGSDQGLIGQFNEVVVDYAIKVLATLPGIPHVWAVGDRAYSRLADGGLKIEGRFTVPNSVSAIAPLVGKIQIESEAHRAQGEYSDVYIFYNHPRSGALYEPVSQRLLPLDTAWIRDLVKIRWPTAILPEIVGQGTGYDTATLRALISEYLFISLFRACAESLASENASRLAAMERADRNIDELKIQLSGDFHRLRQASIDEELFDVISSFEALGGQES